MLVPAEHVGLFAKPCVAGAGECIVSGPQGTQRVLVHDVTRAHDVCNASYRAFKRYSNIFGRTVCFGCRADRRVCVQTMRARRLRMRREAGGGAHAWGGRSQMLCAVHVCSIWLGSTFRLLRCDASSPSGLAVPRHEAVRTENAEI